MTLEPTGRRLPQTISLFLSLIDECMRILATAVQLKPRRQPEECALSVSVLV